MSDYRSRPHDQCQHTDCDTLHETSYAPSNCPISCDACSSFRKLDAEISLTDSHLVELSKQRRSLKIFINERHDPLTRLPTEIVSEIFKFYCTAYSSRRGTCCDQVLVTELGRVCTWWRNVTLRTPQLWTDVTIRADSDQPDYLTITAEWLARSHSLPLSLVLLCSETDPGIPIQVLDPDSDPLASLIHLLRAHSARWQHLSIDFSCDSIIQPLFNNLGSLPSDLGCIHYSGGPFDEDRTYNKDRLLLPKTLTLLGESTTLGLPFGWDRLTSLALIESAYLHEFLDIARSAPNLEDCFISEILGPMNGLALPDPNKPFISLSVTSLHVESDTDNVLLYLTLPSLTTLYYDDRCNSAIGSGILNAFLHRSSPSLKDFTLAIKARPSLKSTSWYEELPGVTTLKFDIDAPEPANDVLDAFSGIGLSLPNLQQLLLGVNLSTEFWSQFCYLIEKPNFQEDQETTLDTATQGLSRLQLLKSFEIQWDKMDDTQDKSQGLQVSMEQSVFSRLVEVERSGVEITLKRGWYAHPFRLSEALNTPPVN